MSVFIKKECNKEKRYSITEIESQKKQKRFVNCFYWQWERENNRLFGNGFKNIGHGHKVAIIQFIKGSWTTGEEKALKNLSSNVSWHSLGEGFTWETQDRVKDEKLVKGAWQIAKKYIKDESYQLIILDEINIATKLGYLSPKEIITFIKSHR